MMFGFCAAQPLEAAEALGISQVYPVLHLEADDTYHGQFQSHLSWPNGL